MNPASPLEATETDDTHYLIVGYETMNDFSFLRLESRNFFLLSQSDAIHNAKAIKILYLW